MGVATHSKNRIPLRRVPARATPMATLPPAGPTAAANAVFPGPSATRPELPTSDLDRELTFLMDQYRRTADRETFERIAKLGAPRLLERVRMRGHFCRGQIDPHEIVQDALVNIYLYPDRFDATRPGAFRAWSSMILDNVLRRWLKKHHSGPRLHSAEWLVEAPDLHAQDPMEAVIECEEGEQDVRTWRVFLALYLRAYTMLSEKERFVLQMVEVHGKSYAALAAELGIRREALKMAVFRARRRLLDRLGGTLSQTAV